MEKNMTKLLNEKLEDAAMRGEWDKAIEALQAGANVNTLVWEGNTPLHQAASWSKFKARPQVMRRFIDAGADLEARNDFDQTPIIAAARYDQIDAVLFLAEAGADVNATEHGDSLLGLLIEKGQPEAVSALLKAGAGPNTGEREPMLSVAVRKGDIVSIDALIEAGADIEAKYYSNGHKGDTALHIAALFGRSEIISRLVEAGADLEARASGDRVPLHEAASRGLVDATKTLLGAGANIEARDSDGSTSLIIASSQPWGENTVQALIDGGADVNAKGWLEKTALHGAARSGRVGAMELLIDAGADIDARDKHGETPIYLAAVGNCPEAVQLLASAGADLEAANLAGKTAYDLAEENGYQSLLNVIVEARAERLEQSLPQVEEHTLEGAKVDMSRPFEERLAEMNKLGPMTKEREAERLAAYKQERAEKEGPDARPVVMKSKCPGFGRF